MHTSESSPIIRTLIVGAVGGIAGGIAEIGWVGLYATATGISLNLVARGIVGSVVPSLSTSAWAVGLGVFIHLSLAVALGIGLALIMPTVLHRPAAREAGFAVTAFILIAVWAVNFLVVLPHINPEFVHLLPYSVTLLSKLLFAVAATTVLQARRLRLARVRAGCSEEQSD